MSSLTPVLKLPDSYRLFLALPQGELYVTPSRGVVRGLEAEVAVGDVVSRNHLARIIVVDAKTKRAGGGPYPASCSIVIHNPHGAVSMKSFTAALIRQARVVCVDGEEDLTVIPFMHAGYSKIIYGQPDVGVVEITGSRRVLKLLALKLLKGLKPYVLKA
ncbi:MAG: DUF359 domain-containing protein [Desulfurococcus sp.]|nr:DUF359 domain-containing protein [Desulfurococcus sp.]